jgi:hypothetical protein
VVLTSPSPIALSLYDLSGELVYKTTVQGNAGVNLISWNLKNQSGQQFASGLYIFHIDIAKGFPFASPSGKVVVLH